MGTTGKIVISVAVGVGLGVSIYQGFFKKDAEGKTFAQRKGWMNASGATTRTGSTSKWYSGADGDEYNAAGSQRRYTVAQINTAFNKLSPGEKRRIAFNEALKQLGNHK